jgi:hypothetical protein
MNKMTPKLFFVGLLFLLPLAYWVWYQYVEFAMAPVLFGVNYMLTYFFPEQVADVGYDSRVLIVTHAERSAYLLNSVSGKLTRGVLQPKSYSFHAAIAGSGVPLFISLALLSSHSLRDLARGVFIGMPALWLEHALTLFSSVLLHPAFSSSIFPQGEVLRISLNYGFFLVKTLGLYILPALFPVLLWILLYPKTVQRIFNDLRGQ